MANHSWGKQLCFDSCLSLCERLEDIEPPRPWHGIAYAAQDDKLIGERWQPSADEAKKSAMTACKQEFPKSNCVSVATLSEGCVGIARRDKGVLYVRSAPRRNGADASAIQACEAKAGPGQCHIFHTYCVYGAWDPASPDTEIGEATAQLRKLREFLAPTPLPQPPPPKPVAASKPTDYHVVLIARINGSSVANYLQWGTGATSDQAEMAAKDACRRTGADCSTLGVYQGTDCAAVAIDRDGSTYMDTGPTIERARKYVYQKCTKAGSGNCSVLEEGYCPAR